MPDSNHSLSLFTAAQAYLALGYSVIPLHGDADPTRAKIAAIQWSSYQHARPTETQLRQWFTTENFAALGIVTGRISRLVVLDFDDPDRFQSFSHQHPDLAKHHVIQTRRGYHIYYHLPPHLTLASRRGQGMDLLSDGRYAVARPSVINGHTYKLICGGQPKLLTSLDIERIIRFFDNQVPVSLTTHLRSVAPGLASAAANPQLPPFSHDCRDIQEAPRERYTPILSPQDLLTVYRYFAYQVGRNEALFRASLRARDAGWNIQETEKCLLEAHIQQQPARPHASENPQQRTQEALRTLQSAFSRSARPLKEHHITHQLPNSVREALLKQKRTDVVRTVEGLRQKGIQPGQSITIDETRTLLGGVVGRQSIYQAFNAQTPDGQPFFVQTPPSAHPRAPDGAAADKNHKLNKKMLFVSAEIPRIIQSGRKKRVFIMPSNLELCQKLGVKPSGSDPISLDDLATAKQTRMAVHRELIKRRPGIYTRRWLARRLGVCLDTLDTYNRDIPIQVKHLYLETRLNWSTLNLVSDNIPIDGAFLEDESGKRYPPKRQIAAILLSKGYSVIYKRQDANYYWYGETPPDVSVVMGLHPHQPEMDVRLKAIKQYVQAQNPTISSARKAAHHLPTANSSSQADLIHTLPVTKQASTNLISIQTKPPKRNYRKPLADQEGESMAQQVYRQIAQRVDGAKGQISQATTRRLVDIYGVILVRQGLSLITRRRNILNPAGFLVTWLQSEFP